MTSQCLWIGLWELALHIFQWSQSQVELLNMMLIESSNSQFPVQVHIAIKWFQIAHQHIKESSLFEKMRKS
ncbi:hypothetical protein D3C80_2078660 [compost metagenome]